LTGLPARIPIDTLEIDRSFVGGFTTDRTQEAISRAIVTLALSMNMHVIGEGIETAEQIDVLRAIGTDSLQGNYISPPLPGARIRGVRRVPRRRRLSGDSATPARERPRIGSGGRLLVVKGALARRVVEFEVGQQIVDDLAVVESDLGKLPPADRHDLVDMSFTAGIRVIDFPIIGVTGLRARDRFGTA